MPQSRDEKCVTNHTAFIYDRGGKDRIAQAVDLSQVQWGRVRDATSEAMIRMEGESCAENAPLIRDVRSHRHELVIFRGNERVWEGPIHRISSHSTYAEIHAKDVTTYLHAQPLTKRHSNATVGGVSNTDTVTGRIEKIIRHELANGRTMRKNGVNIPIPAWESVSPPINVLPHLDVRHFVNEARTAMTTLPFEMSVGAHLQNLSRYNGIDFTTLGRRILIWDVSRELGTLQTLTAADFFSDVIVTEYGADHTQAAYVIGFEEARGSAVDPTHLDYYGPWTTIYTVYNEEGTDGPTQSELDSQAQRNIAGRTPAPIEVRVPDNSGVILSDILRINDLVPGMKVPLRAVMNARAISQDQKIDIVRVTETALGENVQITLTPATRPDSDEVTPG